MPSEHHPIQDSQDESPVGTGEADAAEREVSIQGNRRKPSSMKFFIAVVLLGVLFAFLVGLVLSFLTPGWYTPPAAEDALAVELAQAAEFRLVEEFQKIREPGAPWKLRVPDEAVNAWLAIRLEAWLAHDDRPAWPEFMSAPQIHTTTVGVYVAVGFNASVVGVRIEPVIEDDSLHLHLRGGLIGRLPLPSPPSALLDRLKQAAGAGDEAAAFATAHLLDGQGVPTTLKLVDGRTVQIDEVALDDGAMILTARTMLRSE